jgi:phosphinothricin acetyltransferase
MKIRMVRREDLEVVVAIYNSAVPARLATADTFPVTVASKRAWFEAHDPARRPLWIAETDGAVSGWCSMESFHGRPGYASTVELSVYVAPGFERLGVGSGLLREAIAAAPELGVKTLLGYVFSHNEPSLRLLAGQGFEQWARLPRVAELDGIERDLLILGLRIDEAPADREVTENVGEPGRHGVE